MGILGEGGVILKNFKSIDWLKDNIDREDLIIFDVRHALDDENYGKEAYKKDHIPNAIFIPLEETLTGEVKEHGGRHPLPDMEEFAQNMNDFGLDDESIVVAYDQGNLAMAGRLWWMLRYIGFKEAYVLLGGYDTWESKNYPVNDHKPNIRKGNKLSVNIQEDLIIDMDDVKRTISKDNQILVDSRTSERYKGEVEPMDRIPGHIPGAINLPWTELVDDKFEPEEIKEHFKGLDDYDKLVVHCGSGITATANIMFMEEVDLQPVLYLGGYSDWVSYHENEVIKEN